MCGVTRVGQKSNRYWRKPETLRRSLPAVKLSAMSEIVLATLNAKYIHASFGLRYLMANLGDLRSRASIHEFDINQKVNDIAEALLALNPKIIGFGIYIWNVVPSTELVVILKRLRPDITLILGGPEVSYETEGQPIVAAADYVITGEADLFFAGMCQQILGGARPSTKVHAAPLPDFSRIALPYDFYTEADIAHRVIYLEASRGCPFTCEFCLSSLDIPVRQVPLPAFLAALEKLIQRGVRHFKFVDRTFNLNIAVSKAILEFFLERYRPGDFYHFEMIPDRLPEALREIISRFPPGSLQFEIGIQTFNEEVGERIKRRQNYARLAENFEYLRSRTGVHLHADLIVGLPGESLESFAGGFDRLVSLKPQEIQVGILKRLRGTTLSRHDEEWGMVYNLLAPYELLQNRSLDFSSMQRLRRFSKYWEMISNSGNFLETVALFWKPSKSVHQLAGLLSRESDDSPFFSFLHWSDWLYTRVGRTDSIALVRLMELSFRFLTTVKNHTEKEVAESLGRDYQRGGRKDRPAFLREFLPQAATRVAARTSTRLLPVRQSRHATSEVVLGTDLP